LAALTAYVALAIGEAPAAAFESAGKQVVLIDFQTGTEMYAKNADEPMAPASMTKMMTIYLLFERLKDGRLSLDDTMFVSKKAWRKGGSKMFVEVGKRVRVEDLIRGIIVQSGNDASIVVAEGLAGSEEAFASEMNRKAQELGMSRTNFRNASGWPDPEHTTTARDLAILVQATIRNFPDFYHYYAEKKFEYNGIKQFNRNPLLYREIGADGLKTGHTVEAGFGLAASAKRNGRRLVLVINGLPSEKARRIESERLFDWGFREFNNYQLFEPGDRVTEAEVWLGDKKKVALVASRGVLLTMKRQARRSLVVKAVYDEPLPAPLAKGSKFGRVIISAADNSPIELDLLVGEDVGRLGVAGRLSAALRYLLLGPSQ
jgi:D-alanyl-D-alanine carboxypeptidase (penicillin-binding protein 5/6)